jgi:hypothetical protein
MSMGREIRIAKKGRLGGTLAVSERLPPMAAWRPPRNSKMIFPTEEAAPAAAKQVLNWWTLSSKPLSGQASGSPPRFVVALSRPEIVASLELAGFFDRNEALSIKRSPPHAKVDKRLARLVANNLSQIEQPHLVACGTKEGGVGFQIDPSRTPVSEVHGLLKALADVEATKPLVRSGRAFVPVFLRSEKLDEVIQAGKKGQSDRWLRVAYELEHSVRKSISRLGGQRFGRAEVAGDDRLPGSVRAQLAFLKAEIEKSWTRAAEQAPSRAKPAGGAEEERLVCMVVSRSAGEPAKLEYCGSFPGSFVDALQRVSAVLGFGYERMLFRRFRTARWTSVLQEIVLAPTVSEFGALADEREILRRAAAATKIANQGDRAAIAGLARVKAKQLTRADHPWHRSELEAVLDLWGLPKEERYRVSRIQCSRPWKKEPEEISLDPHEKGRWRLEARSNN